MTDVGQTERKTQDRVIAFFKNSLDYRYLGDLKDRKDNSNIKEDILKEYLQKRGYSDELIRKAMFELTRKAALPDSKKLYEHNKEVYHLLRYGIAAKETAGDKNERLYLINWEEPLKNDFAIAEEVTIKGQNTKRPDIVLYINGIAIGVIELKRCTHSIHEGIRQNLDNQTDIFIAPFFTTIQLIMAGTDSEGIRYGTTHTKEKYYLTWKEESPIENPLDRHLSQLCKKERLLELIHDFVCFDGGIKKLCRPHQYFGIKAAQESIRKNEGGIIWHTQGSGKSLIMVWLTQWITENFHNARVLIVTDRIELDDQIEKVFKNANEKIYRTKSGKDLIEKLNATLPRLICSLIHKFGGRNEEKQYENYIEELKNSLPKDFKPKGDIIVFIDECHRTQSDKLHKAMKKILPDGLFIGFTGTPLFKEDKKTSLQTFGKFIHTYKFDEGVQDKVILDLLYEARDIDQELSSPDKIDRWFESKTKGLTEYATARLKQKWGTMKNVLSSESRLHRIVSDICLDMETEDRLKNGKGNALLVAGSIYEACKYYELFQNRKLKQCAIITSFNPTPQKIKGENTGEDMPTDNLLKNEIYKKMLDGQDPEKFQKDVKKIFTEEPARMKLLIVVDMLLTGFDAPPATYLYIDKKMQDHGLFQAICRVNRLDGEDKKFGYIIDYKDLFLSLEKSIKDYTSGAFDAYEKCDIDGLLSNRIDKSKERLDQALEAISILCEPVDPPKKNEDYIHYFVTRDPGNQEQIEKNKPKRLELYKYTAALIRSYSNIANEMEEAGYTLEQIKKIKSAVSHYESVRRAVQHASCDYIDLKRYEADMRHLIDTYIDAKDSVVISQFEDITLLDLILQNGTGIVTNVLPELGENEEAIAEIVENNMRRIITDETPANPKYFEKMSLLLDEIIKERKANAATYKEHLAKIKELHGKVKHPEGFGEYPARIDTRGKRALYDNLDKNETLAEAIHNEILSTRKDSWRGHKIKEREIENAIKKHIPHDEETIKRIFILVEKQYDEY